MSQCALFKKSKNIPSDQKRAAQIIAGTLTARRNGILLHSLLYLKPIVLYLSTAYNSGFTSGLFEPWPLKRSMNDVFVVMSIHRNEDGV